MLGPILDSEDMHTIFQKKDIWKFGQKCTKFENISKKGSLMCATITCMKQLKYPLMYGLFSYWNSKEKYLLNSLYEKLKNKVSLTQM